VFEVVLLLLILAVGLVVAYRVFTGPGPTTTATILERDREGILRVIQGDDSTKWPPHEGPPLRAYTVRDDGAVEYSDGEVVEPDVTKIRPPDMRLVP
jgi:hypothetical protein